MTLLRKSPARPASRRLAWLWLLVALLAFAGGYWLGGSGGHDTTPDAPGHDYGHEHSHAAPAATPGDSGSEVAYWTCSMHPWIRLPDPGLCPICAMDLIPVAKGQQDGAPVSLRAVTLTPAARALARVELAPVERRAVDVATRLLGRIEVDETSQAYITARVAGRLDRLHVNVTGGTVKAGQVMAEIYSPELVAAQAELLEARKAVTRLSADAPALLRDTAARTERAARDKLRLLGFSAAEVETVLRRGTPADHMALTAPAGGVVVRREVQEGAYVATGTRLFAIADLSRVWAVFEAYEADLPWLRMGAAVRFEATGLPGETFTGAVTFIDPVIDTMTRTFRVRLDVANPGGRLKPGMLVHAVQQTAVEAQAGQVLTIPVTAALVTGTRAIVYVADPNTSGSYEGREIVLGPRAGDHYVVRQGLAEGEQVVVRGNFLVDSAAQLMAAPSMMLPEGAGEPGALDGVPPPFLRQLPALDAPMEAVLAAARGTDLEAGRQAFAALGQALAGLDAATLVDEPALHWKELAMLLGNDIRLGRDSRSMTELRWHARELDARMQRLRRTFDYAAQAAQAAGPGEPGTPAPPAVQAQLGEVLAAYLRLQEALARDDAPAAQAAVQGLEDAWRAVPLEGLAGLDGLDGEAGAALEAIAAQMEQGLMAMQEQTSLEAMRAGFQPVSNALIQAALTVGIVHQGDLFRVHCPMAFDYTGADWLQPDPDIRNPYFGHLMPGCGDVTGQVPVAR